MPFAKWNLEPVYVARTTPWTLPIKVVRPSASSAAAATTSSPNNDDHKLAPKLPNISIKLNRIGSKQQYHDNGDTIIINGVGNIDDDEDGEDGETTQTSGAKINGDHHQPKKPQQQQPPQPPHPSQSPLINGSIDNEDDVGGASTGGDARNKLDHLKNNGQHPKGKEEDEDEDEIMFIDGQDNHHHHHHHHHVNDDNGQNIGNVGDDDDGKLSKKLNHNILKKNTDAAIYSFAELTNGNHHHHHQQQHHDVIVVHHPKDLTDDEQILLKIHNRTLVGVIKQMVSLLSASDQMFQELTDECRRLMDRSGKLRQRFQKLTTGVDRLNHLMRHTAPRIGNIFHYKQLSKEVKHYRSELKLDRSLFTLDTRPLSVRNLYARAHAPGDVRLSCTVFSPFGRQQSIQQNRSQNNMQLMLMNNCQQSKLQQQQQQQQCQCQCGQCHPISTTTATAAAGDQQKSSNQIIPNDNLFKNVINESDYETSRRSCECCNNDENINGISPESNESTSSSSIVTWSSVTSSTFESMGHHHHNHNHHHHHHHRTTQPSQQSTTTTNTTISQQQQQQQQSLHQQTQQQQQQNQQSTLQNKSMIIKSSKAKIKPMSSFSSSGDYYPNGTKTIDDFFRKNNIVDDPIKHRQQNQRDSQCRCSCFERQMATPDAGRITDCLKSVEFKDPLNTGEKSLHHHHHQHHLYPQSINIVPPISLSRQASSNGAIYNPDDYWYWWWWWAEDENRRRWSSALTGSSPLKPTILDEMTIWLRENIETRRPESLVIKSASELPKSVLLERALSPPCSSHNITLRKRTEPNGMDFNDGKNGTYPKLKRRWSLLPFRRLSKRWSKRFDHTKRTSLVLIESNENENLETIKNQKNNEHSSHENLINLDDDQEEEDDEPKEIVLMSPEERSKLLADQFAQFSMVDIDVSGRSFDRLSKTRRSLIHADFQIPRNKIPGQRRSRSKSPHPRSSKLNNGDEQQHNSDSMVSPYALSQLIVQDKQSKMNRTIEKGCQTDTNLLLGGLLNKTSVSGSSNVGNNSKTSNKFMVPIDVHNNDDDDDDEDFRKNPNNFRKTKATSTMNEFDARRFMRRSYQDNDNGADGDEDMDDEDNEDEDDEYVVILKKHPNSHNHYYHHNLVNQKPNQIRLDDTTSSNASVDMEWMKRLQDGNKTSCLASSPMIQTKMMMMMMQPSPPSISSTTSKLPSTTAATATAATISKVTSSTMKQQQQQQQQNQESQSTNDEMNLNVNLNQKSKQNGARSSSGNWSAATSDLVHSSSSSSSPPLHVLKRHLTNQSKAGAATTATTIVDPGTTSSASAAAATVVSGSVGRPLLNPKSLNIKDQVQQQPPLSLSTGNTGNTGNNNSSNGGANEEAESVYSVDNDGYYTSMHTDSGLFFGSNSLPLVHPHHHHLHPHQHHPNQGINNVRNRSNISTFTSQTSLSKRQQQQQQQQQLIDINRNKIKLNKIKKSEENFRISLLSRWKRFNNSSAVGVSAKNNPEFLQNIDDDDDDDAEDDDVKQSLLENDLRKSKDQPQYGSNVSINSILSNSDAATSTANMDHASFGTNSSMVDFDCSVSHCSHQIASTSSGHHHHNHQNTNNKDNMMIMMRKMKSNNRMRSVSGGTYDETNQNNNTLRRSSTSNSSETLHTNDYDDEILPEADSAIATTSNMKQKCSRSNVEKIQAVNVAKSVGLINKTNCSKRYASLTESSSNSSSCRKLPPPPPPPRVSSMLRTLQKYNSNPGSRPRQQQQQQQQQHKQRRPPPPLQQRGSSVSSYAGSDITSGIPTITSQTTTKTNQQSDSQQNNGSQDGNANALHGGGGGDLSLTSETNSEYLHEKHDERRRRLFLEVDSNRSYPPLSYIYDQTDTATSVSIPSSACFEIEELELDHHHHQQPRNNDNNGGGGRNMDSVSTELADKTVAMVDGGKKQLEERHLSSPLPPPKLDSFTFNNNNKNPISKSSGGGGHHHYHHYHHYHHQNHGSSPKLRSKSSSSSSSSATTVTKTTTTITITTTSNNAQQVGDAYSSKLSSTSSLSSSTIKAPSSPESIPKPKPRNSLIFSNSSSTFTTSHETESKDSNSNVEDSKRITESLAKPPPNNFSKPTTTTSSSTSTSKPSSSNPGSGAGRRLTTEDLFIILHNSKKRHNIRSDPQIIPPTNHRLAISPNGSSSNGSGTRSPICSPDQGWKSASPVTSIAYRVPETMKRRSWTTAADSLQKNSNAQVPRTRQSLALDRLGPVRPTTLNDFKRLLSQVRSTTSISGGQQGSGSGTGAGGSTSPTSIYVALQQVLKSNSVSHENHNEDDENRSSSLSSNTENAMGSQSQTVSSPPSSGVSSLSPMCSPLSPYKSISSKSPIIASSPIKRHNCHNPNQSLPNTAVGHHQSHQSQPASQSMNNFMKKFSKSKLLSNMYLSNAERSGNSIGTNIGTVGSSITSGMSRSSTVSARLDVCPTIPEDDSVCTATALDTPNTPTMISTTNKTDNAKSTDLQDPISNPTDKSNNKKDDNCSESSKHNCTSTWV